MRFTTDPYMVVFGTNEPLFTLNEKSLVVIYTEQVGAGASTLARLLACCLAHQWNKRDRKPTIRMISDDQDVAEMECDLATAHANVIGVRPDDANFQTYGLVAQDTPTVDLYDTNRLESGDVPRGRSGGTIVVCRRNKNGTTRNRSAQDFADLTLRVRYTNNFSIRTVETLKYRFGPAVNHLWQLDTNDFFGIDRRLVLDEVIARGMSSSQVRSLLARARKM